MFGKKKPQENQKRRPVGRSSLAQFGLLDMPDINDISGMNEGGSDDDDESLEAELEAIVSGSAPARQPRQPKTVSAIETIDKLAEECMKDVDNDEDDDDENLSGDEELMSELTTLSSSKELSVKASDHTHSQAIHVPAVSKLDHSLISTLEQRLSSYKSAESNAKTSGDGSRARRYGRGVKTLEDLLRAAKAGKSVNEEDIPPSIQIKPVQPGKVESSAVPPVQLSRETGSPFHEGEVSQSLKNSDLPPPLPPKRRSAQFEQGSSITSAAPEPNIPPSTKSSVTKQVDTTHKMLCSRRDQYKISALKAKKAGDMPIAMKFIKIAKQFDEVIDAVEKGDAVDLSNMPPSPPDFQEKKIANPPYRAAPQLPVSSQVQQSSDTVQVEAPDDPSLFKAPPPPASIEEALEQRLEKYRSTMEVAKNEGQNSKVRRLGRICKQYEDAIKNHKAGKPTNYEELPVPPGFGPIPLEKEENGSSSQIVPTPHPAAPPRGQNTPQAVNKPLVTPRNNTPHSQQGGRPDLSHKKDKPLQRTQSSVLDKQMKFLLDRQRMFKQAALEAKKRGDIQQAKEYLKMSMGLDPMIEATRSGLPIDATSIPTPPQLQEDFVIVEAKDCSITGEPTDIEEMYRKLERDLSQQIQ
ncbi:coiled-coil and C2 domain-containing protein 1-like, partial [Limulus polyphemus]|uniref:Coiled-coil and C2 domain-containing protein 1-like n=1 Tax=Limulus polyphemus TaxID=6850 RepID=A0ABM1BSZ0_LIMPO